MQAQLAQSAHSAPAARDVRISTAFRQPRRQAPKTRRSVTAAAAATQDVAQLKQKLMSIIDKNNASTSFPEEALPVLEEVCSAVEADGVPEITPESIRGKYRQVLSSTSFVGPEGDVRLGVLTFNQFGPKDLKLRLVGVELLQGLESPDQYSTEATFEILEGPLAGVRGLQKTLGRYEVTGETPGRQDVYFSGVLIKPKEALEGKQLASWIDTLKPHNATMDDAGAAVVEFPGGAAHGFRDFRIKDDDLELSVGNRKSYVAVQPIH